MHRSMGYPVPTHLILATRHLNLYWIEQALGRTCKPLSASSQYSARCFGLPFIEDVPGEGFEPDLATAIAIL
jgi:hypothetical protein